MKLLVVIPTYNEVLSVTEVISDLLSINPELCVLVVDDSSPDGTAATVKEMESDRIFVLERPQKSGLGAAYRAGFLWALEREEFTHVASMDGDGSHRPVDLAAMIGIAPQVDVVMGSRWIDGGGIRNWPKYRQFLSRFGTAYARWALKIDRSDLTGGLKIYSASMLRRMEISAVVSEGYCFQIEMIRAAVACKATFAEVPIIFIERAQGVSKMSNRIVMEALIRVTLWGLEQRIRPNADKLHYVK